MFERILFLKINLVNLKQTYHNTIPQFIHDIT